MGQTPQDQGSAPAPLSFYGSRRKVDSVVDYSEEPVHIDRRQGIYVTAATDIGHSGCFDAHDVQNHNRSNGINGTNGTNGYTVPPRPVAPAAPTQAPLPPSLAPVELGRLQAQLRAEVLEAPLGSGVAADSLQRQAAALQLVRARSGAWAPQRRMDGAGCGILPKASSEASATKTEVEEEIQNGNGNGAAEVEHVSTMRFMTKEEVQRMRTEMRQHCSRRQQEISNKRKPSAAGDCPLLLSVRMQRIMEFALKVRLPAAEEAKEGSQVNALQLDDNVAQAAAALIFHHHFSPATVAEFLDEANLQTNGAPGKVYQNLLETMGRELRDKMPSNVNLAPYHDGRLPAVSPTAADSVLRLMGPPASITPKGLAPRIGRGFGGGASGVFFGSEFQPENLVINRRLNMVDLPIYQKKQLIQDTVRHNRITLLQGETGSGKTTQVAQYILEMLKDGGHRGARIVCTQPRRIAAITVAKRVADELGEVCGEGLVGYKIRGVSVVGPNCKILFCTTGVLLRRIGQEGQSNMFSPRTMTHLLVDEIHERGCEVDFMLTFLKEVIEDRPDLRVVLMSATMDAECFLKYFAIKADQSDTHEPPLVLVSGRCFPTHEVFLETIHSVLGRETPAEGMSFEQLRSQGSPQSLSENDGIDYELVMSILLEIDKTDDGAQRFITEKDSCVKGDLKDGAVLIFLPGAGEIQQLMATIDEGGAPPHWWVVPLHGALPAEEQQEAFKTTLPEGRTWKIIIATNVAETSVTVPDVTVVIDSCRERRTGIDKFSNTPQLKEQWCAQDSLHQRRGRAGRVRPGICLRLISQRKMEGLDTKTPPEMQRVPLENLYLQCCACGIEDKEGFLAKTPDPPEEASVQFAKAILTDMGALDTAEADGLTPLGRHLAAMPCHPRLGKILLLGCLLGVPGPVMSICAAMSGRSPMRTSQDQAKRSAWQAERQKLLKELGHKSDHCVWAVLMQLWNSDGVVRRDLCNAYGLSYERMSAAYSERKHLAEALTQAGFLSEGFLQAERELEEHRLTAPPDWTVVRAAISGGLFPNVVRVEKTAPKNPSNADQGERNKWMRYSFLQRQLNGGDGAGYPKSCNMHPNSICFGSDHFDCPLMVFYTIQQTTKLYVYDASEATPWALLLFGTEPVWNESSRCVEVAGWARFHCTHKEPIWSLIGAARAAVRAVLSRKVVDVGYDPATSPELAACVELIRTWGLGFHPLGEEPTWPFLQEFREEGERQAADLADKKALGEANV